MTTNLLPARQVPWISRAEWDFVRNCLFESDGDHSLYREAVGRITTWKSRLGSKFPLALDCTSGLITATLSDTRSANKENVSHMYGIALLRCISLLTDSVQDGIRAVPMHTLADKMGIPDWIVDLRHNATHAVLLPSISVLRAGVNALLQWLKREFWDKYDPGSTHRLLPEDESISDFKAESELGRLLIEFQQEQFKHLDSAQSLQKSKSQYRSHILRKIKSRLSNQDARSTFVWLLTQDGYLAPTDEQMEVMGITFDSSENEFPEIDQKFLLFWKPVLSVIHSKYMTISLVEEIVRTLSKISDVDENQSVISCLMGWVSAMIQAAAKPKMVTSNSINLFEDTFINPRLKASDWHALLLTCMMHMNKHSALIFKLLLEDVLTNLTSEIKNKLYTLAQISSMDMSSGIEEISSCDDISEELLNRLLSKKSPGKRKREAERKEVEILAEEADPVIPWMLSSDSVIWSDYPMGILPGQSDDPQCFTLRMKHYPHKLDSFSWPTNHDRNDSENVQPQDSSDHAKPVKSLENSITLTTDYQRFNMEEVCALKRTISLF